MKLKKILFGFISIFMLFGTRTTFATESNSVPLRSTMDDMGALVGWNDGNRIIIFINNLKINCKAGSNIITANEREYKLDSNIYVEDNISYISQDGINLIHNIILYNTAVTDAVIADKEEIMPLISIDSKDKVLVCTWNKYPESYVSGSDITAGYGPVWVFTPEELEKFTSENFTKKDISNEDMILRLEQLIGLPPQAGYTHFSYLWVDTKDLLRPSPDNEINDKTAELTFPKDTPYEYRQWFSSKSVDSYLNSAYPWTRLGYTYDCADNGTEYGLSEFIIKTDSKIKVEKTISNEEFFQSLKK